jgi:hypothetical protein
VLLTTYLQNNNAAPTFLPVALDQQQEIKHLPIFDHLLSPLKLNTHDSPPFRSGPSSLRKSEEIKLNMASRNRNRPNIKEEADEERNLWHTIRSDSRRIDSVVVSHIRWCEGIRYSCSTAFLVAASQS